MRKILALIIPLMIFGTIISDAKDIVLGPNVIYSGKAKKGVPMGEGQLMVFDNDLVMDSIIGTFNGSSVSNAKFYLGLSTVELFGGTIFDGSLSYKVEGNSVEYVLQSGKFTMRYRKHEDRSVTSKTFFNIKDVILHRDIPSRTIVSETPLLDLSKIQESSMDYRTLVKYPTIGDKAAQYIMSNAGYKSAYYLNGKDSNDKLVSNMYLVISPQFGKDIKVSLGKGYINISLPNGNTAKCFSYSIEKIKKNILDMIDLHFRNTDARGKMPTLRNYLEILHGTDTPYFERQGPNHNYAPNKLYVYEIKTPEGIITIGPRTDIFEMLIGPRDYDEEKKVIIQKGLESKLTWKITETLLRPCEIKYSNGDVFKGFYLCDAKESDYLLGKAPLPTKQTYFCGDYTHEGQTIHYWYGLTSDELETVYEKCLVEEEARQQEIKRKEEERMQREKEEAEKKAALEKAEQAEYNADCKIYGKAFVDAAKEGKPKVGMPFKLFKKYYERLPRFFSSYGNRWIQVYYESEYTTIYETYDDDRIHVDAKTHKITSVVH